MRREEARCRLVGAEGSGELDAEAERRAVAGERCEAGESAVRRTKDELRESGGLDELTLLPDPPPARVPPPSARLLLLLLNALPLLLAVLLTVLLAKGPDC